MVGEIRELRREDLAALAEPRAPVRTKTFRDTHHNLARMVASGSRPAEIVELSGYSHGRLNTLMGDPSFLELVAHYREVVNDSFKEQLDHVHQSLVLARGKAARMLNDKLEEVDETGELPPVRELLGILELTADRTGYGKRETKVNVNVDLAANLEKAIQRKERAMKEVRAVESPPMPEPPRLAVVPPESAGAPNIRRRV